MKALFCKFLETLIFLVMGAMLFIFSNSIRFTVDLILVSDAVYRRICVRRAANAVYRLMRRLLRGFRSSNLLGKTSRTVEAVLSLCA